MFDCGPEKKMSLKQQIIKELLEDLNDKESVKLKPKVAEVSVEEMPEEKTELAMGDDSADEEMSDEDLKKLMHEYMGA